MKYERIKEGRFIKRPNRFIAHVEIDGENEICHVKNTGRCRELLLPGSRVLVEEAKNPERKTRYDLVQVYKGENLVSMDSQMPNKLVKEWLESGRFLPGITKLQTEKTYGNSRFDLYVEYEGKKAFIEVKGVTLEEEGRAKFPDAPTLRGIKHMKELSESVKEGYEAWIIFVIQMKGVHRFSPNWKTHPEFGEELLRVCRAGVHVLAVDCSVKPGEIHIDHEIPVDLEEYREGTEER